MINVRTPPPSPRSLTWLSPGSPLIPELSSQSVWRVTFGYWRAYRAFKVPPLSSTQALAELILRLRGEKKQRKNKHSCCPKSSLPKVGRPSVCVHANCLQHNFPTPAIPLCATIVSACELTDLWAFCIHHHFSFFFFLTWTFRER